MYCPECGGEYRKGIETCPTCEVPLTEVLDAGGGRGGGLAVRGEGMPGPRVAPAYVDLVQFEDEVEARAARGRLREARIPSELVVRDGDADAGAEPVEEFWVRVPGAAVRAAADALHLDQELSEDTCPICGAAFGSEGVCPHCAETFEA